MDARARRDRRLAVLIVLPLGAFIAVFLLVPTVVVLQRALSLDGGLGADALRRAITDAQRTWFLDAVAVCAVSALLGGLLGVLMALAVASRTRPRWLRSALTTWATNGSGVGGVPLAFAFVATIGVQGVLTRLLTEAGLDLDPGDATPGGFWPLVAVYLYFQVPLMLLVMLPAAASMPRAWRDAARVLGSSPARYWRSVGVPVLAPAALGGAVLLFVTAFTAHATARVLDTEHRLLPDRIRLLVHGDTAQDDVGMTTVAWVIALLLCSLLLSTVLQRRTLRWTSQ